VLLRTRCQPVHCCSVNSITFTVHTPSLLLLFDTGCCNIGCLTWCRSSFDSIVDDRREISISLLNQWLRELFVGCIANRTVLSSMGNTNWMIWSHGH
jgi:hypothetical protein